MLCHISLFPFQKYLEVTYAPDATKTQTGAYSPTLSPAHEQKESTPSSTAHTPLTHYTLSHPTSCKLALSLFSSPIRCAPRLNNTTLTLPIINPANKKPHQIMCHKLALSPIFTLAIRRDHDRCTVHQNINLLYQTLCLFSRLSLHFSASLNLTRGTEQLCLVTSCWFLL